MQDNSLEVDYVSPDELNPNPRNPRELTKKQKEDLKNSIKEFDLVKPLIVNQHSNRKNIVVGGHQRLKILKELNREEVPVVYVNLDKEKEEELNLRLNKNQGQWDWDKLKDFDVENLLEFGFDDSDLSNIWDDALSIENDEFDTQKELEEIGEPESKIGDVYKLGNHILVCGDSTNLDVVKTAVKDTEPTMIYCDPPYNIGLDYNKGIGGKQNYGGSIDDNKDKHEYRQFLKQTMSNALEVADSDTHVFYYTDEAKIGLIQDLFRQLGLKNRRVCLWIKNGHTPTPQVAFNKAYEPCVYATKEKPYLNDNATKLNEILNKEVGSGNRLADDIADIWNIWLAKRKASSDYRHATEKPADLHEKPIRRVTKPGETILDLFGGSGSTLVAAEQMNRKSVLVEIEPVFVDLIIKRFKQLTNKDVKKIN